MIWTDRVFQLFPWRRIIRFLGIMSFPHFYRADLFGGWNIADGIVNVDAVTLYRYIFLVFVSVELQRRLR